MRLGNRGRKAQRPFLDRPGEHGLHLVEILVARLLAHRAFAHDDAADRRVAREKAGVEADRTIQPIEIIAKALPVPRHRGFESLQRHAFDPRQHRREIFGRFGRQRRYRKAAKASQHRGHAMKAGGAERRVPEDLHVVMGVDIDEAGRNDPACRIDGLARFFAHFADCDDAPVPDADIAGKSWAARAIDDRAAGNLEIQHCSLPSLARPQQCRWAGVQPFRCPIFYQTGEWPA